MATGRIKKEIEVSGDARSIGPSRNCILKLGRLIHFVQDLRNDKASGMSVVVDPFNPKHLTGVSRAVDESLTSVAVNHSLQNH